MQTLREVEEMHLDLMELKVGTAMLSNRIVRLDSPIVFNELARLERVLKELVPET
jgi:hypothetical protein